MNSLPALDAALPTPLHQQVEQVLRKLIGEPRHQGGACLPDELSLARDLHVSRGTVREAIKRLVSEGLIERKAGVGTRVVKGRVKTALSQWPSFSREMSERGIQIVDLRWRHERRPAPRDIAPQLGVEVGRPVQRLVRLRGSDGEPMVLMQSWFSPRVGGLSKLRPGLPLYEQIAAIRGIEPMRSDETLSAVPASARLSKALGVALGDPLLLRRRRVYDHANNLIELAMNWYRADVFSYSVTLTRGGPR